MQPIQQELSILPHFQPQLEVDLNISEKCVYLERWTRYCVRNQVYHQSYPTFRDLITRIEEEYTDTLHRIRRLQIAENFRRFGLSNPQQSSEIVQQRSQSAIYAANAYEYFSRNGQDSDGKEKREDNEDDDEEEKLGIKELQFSMIHAIQDEDMKILLRETVTSTRSSNKLNSYLLVLRWMHLTHGDEIRRRSITILQQRKQTQRSGKHSIHQYPTKIGQNNGIISSSDSEQEIYQIDEDDEDEGIEGGSNQNNAGITVFSLPRIITDQNQLDAVLFQLGNYFGFINSPKEIIGDVEGETFAYSAAKFFADYMDMYLKRATLPLYSQCPLYPKAIRKGLKEKQLSNKGQKGKNEIQQQDSKGYSSTGRISIGPQQTSVQSHIQLQGAVIQLPVVAEVMSLEYTFIKSSPWISSVYCQGLIPPNAKLSGSTSQFSVSSILHNQISLNSNQVYNSYSNATYLPTPHIPTWQIQQQTRLRLVQIDPLLQTELETLKILRLDVLLDRAKILATTHRRRILISRQGRRERERIRKNKRFKINDDEVNKNNNWNEQIIRESGTCVGKTLENNLRLLGKQKLVSETAAQSIAHNLGISNNLFSGSGISATSSNQSASASEKRRRRKKRRLESGNNQVDSGDEDDEDDSDYADWDSDINQIQIQIQSHQQIGKQKQKGNISSTSNSYSTQQQQYAQATDIPYFNRKKLVALQLLRHTRAVELRQRLLDSLNYIVSLQKRLSFDTFCYPWESENEGGNETELDQQHIDANRIIDEMNQTSDDKDNNIKTDYITPKTASVVGQQITSGIEVDIVDNAIHSLNSTSIVPLPKSPAYSIFTSCEPIQYSFNDGVSGSSFIEQPTPSQFNFTPLYSQQQNINNINNKQTNINLIPDLNDKQMRGIMSIGDKRDRIELQMAGVIQAGSGYSSGRMSSVRQRLLYGVNSGQSNREGDEMGSKYTQIKTESEGISMINKEDLIIRDKRGVTIMYEGSLAWLEQIEGELLRIASFYLGEAIEQNIEDDWDRIERKEEQDEDMDDYMKKKKKKKKKDNNNKQPGQGNDKNQMKTNENEYKQSRNKVSVYSASSFGIDRQTLLCDILECEVLFQRSKRRLCDLYLEAYELTDQISDRLELSQIICDLVALRP
ncbi:MAG: hypothetical protein EZS28_003116 [Streblomastix strix]|uniref:Uncharacterized protein n=1 Tax=Streblomastix strix TaxID=222440 RepID=A0A5J4X3X2_9EUKA|nr:MAG: hypothetical protein EZS28_003116 [Streblomastix strix]